MKSSTRIFVPLTDWEDYTTKRGIGVGRVQRKRKVLAADKWNWILAEEVEGNKQLQNETFRPSMKSVIPDIHKLVGQAHHKDAIQRVVGALVKATKIYSSYDVDESSDPFKHLYNLGAWLDRTYATSFANPYPPEVYKKIFPDASSEETAEVVEANAE